MDSDYEAAMSRHMTTCKYTAEWTDTTARSRPSHRGIGSHKQWPMYVHSHTATVSLRLCLAALLARTNATLHIIAGAELAI